MRTIIIYKSFLGATKQYAEWLAEDMKCECLKFREASDEKISQQECVVVCSGTYAGWMPLTKFLKKKWPLIKDKKVIVMAVGSVPVDDPWSRKSYEKIPAEIREKIKYFKIMGGDKKQGMVKRENLQAIVACLGNCD